MWHKYTKSKTVYSAIFTLKKDFYYVIMPTVVTKGYKLVIISYKLAINIRDTKYYERQKLFYDKKQN